MTGTETPLPNLQVRRCVVGSVRSPDRQVLVSGLVLWDSTIAHRLWDYDDHTVGCVNSSVIYSFSISLDYRDTNRDTVNTHQD
jgi:hypothetical protein